MQSSRGTGQPRSKRTLVLLLLTMLTPSCSVSLPRILQPETPPPSVELMESEDASSKDYSQKVQRWQQKALEELKRLEPKPLPCKITSNGCA